MVERPQKSRTPRPNRSRTQRRPPRPRNGQKRRCRRHPLLRRQPLRPRLPRQRLRRRLHQRILHLPQFQKRRPPKEETKSTRQPPQRRLHGRPPRIPRQQENHRRRRAPRPISQRPRRPRHPHGGVLSHPRRRHRRDHPRGAHLGRRTLRRPPGARSAHCVAHVGSSSGLLAHFRSVGPHRWGAGGLGRSDHRAEPGVELDRLRGRDGVGTFQGSFASEVCAHGHLFHLRAVDASGRTIGVGIPGPRMRMGGNLLQGRQRPRGGVARPSR
mmetsp:Transcript_31721/g.63195  ORF Transcript_31721/g.63195 Transcript_31721/m.63195 type:complete len:270 (+) Transcript_31721:388-1197(+)